MGKLKQLLYKSLIKTKAGKFILNAGFKLRFSSASDYWENRYKKKGTSGTGSYGALATYKAGFLNDFVIKNNIARVIEFGCGDGNQLQQFQFPSYIGLDVSISAIEKCIFIFNNDRTKSFFIYNPVGFTDPLHTFKGDLALSLDVIYHLLEDKVFEKYIRHLFSSSARFVIIYAWDVESQKTRHIKHRKFTMWIEQSIKDFSLIHTLENKDLPGACNFFVYEKVDYKVES